MSLFPITLIHIQVWPTLLLRSISCLFWAVIYHPQPDNAVAERLMDRIQLTLDRLTTIHPNSGFIGKGDFNQLEVTPLLYDRRYRQIMHEPTRGTCTLDKIISNVSQFYNNMNILIVTDWTIWPWDITLAARTLLWQPGHYSGSPDITLAAETLQSNICAMVTFQKHLFLWWRWKRLLPHQYWSSRIHWKFTFYRCVSSFLTPPHKVNVHLAITGKVSMTFCDLLAKMCNNLYFRICFLLTCSTFLTIPTQPSPYGQLPAELLRLPLTTVSAHWSSLTDRCIFNLNLNSTVYLNREHWFTLPTLLGEQTKKPTPPYVPNDTRMWHHDTETRPKGWNTYTAKDSNRT